MKQYYIMQSSRVIKLSSRQSAPITQTQNLLDFELPAGKFDLSRSYLVMESQLDQPANNLNIFVGSYPGNTDNIYDNISLVRHASLRSATKGVIETSRHVNVLRSNLKPLTDSSGERFSDLYTGKFQGMPDRNGLMGSQWRELEKTGTTASVSKSHEHIIPLSDIFNFAKHDYYDTQRHGDLSINLEMAPESLAAQVVLSDAVGSLIPGAAYWPTIEAPETAANRDITTPAPAPGTGTNFPQPVTMTRKYDTIGNSPFFVGQVVTVAGTNVAAVDTRITEITYTQSTRTIQLSFNDVLPVAGGDASNMVITSRTGAAGPTPVFPKCDLVLVEVDEIANPPDEYQYTTYKVQEDTQPTANLNKTYQIGPLCKNVMLCMPPAGAGANPRDLHATKRVDTYRFSVNNKFIQNRLIPTLSGNDHITGLHKTQQMKTFDNMDDKMKGNGYFFRAGLRNDTLQPADVDYMLMTPVPLTGSQKMFGVEINMNAGAGNVDQLYIFEETLAMLK